MVYTVALDEVKDHVGEWKAAIRKEVQALFEMGALVAALQTKGQAGDLETGGGLRFWLPGEALRAILAHGAYAHRRGLCPSSSQSLHDG